jgi:hypothetical protein
MTETVYSLRSTSDEISGLLDGRYVQGSDSVDQCCAERPGPRPRYFPLRAKNKGQTRLMSTWILLHEFFPGLSERLLRESQAESFVETYG